MPTQKLTVVARIKAKAGKEEDVLREILSLTTPTRAKAAASTTTCTAASLCRS